VARANPRALRYTVQRVVKRQTQRYDFILLGDCSAVKVTSIDFLIYSSRYSRRVLVDRTARSHKGSGLPLVLGQLGVLSAAGTILYLYDAQGVKRWYSNGKARCDSSTSFTEGASVVIDKAAKSSKSYLTGEDAKVSRSGDQAPPSQAPVEEKEKVDELVSCSQRTVFHRTLDRT
jgi:hypothetical protein